MKLSFLLPCFAEAYNVDDSLISVSGLSSGAFFAVQFHVAFSKTIMGVGVIAGGPYYCAQNDLKIALTACSLNPDLISIPELVEITYATAATLTIDSPAHMKDDQVYIFSGLHDHVVVQGNVPNWPVLQLECIVHTSAAHKLSTCDTTGVAEKLAEYYAEFLYTGKMLTELSIPAEHAFVSSAH